MSAPRTIECARRAERGLTLIETTVILSVLFILAGTMSPVVSDSIGTARKVRAQQDVDQIAVGLVNFLRDLTALVPLNGTSSIRDLNGRRVVGLLVSAGDAPGLPDAAEFLEASSAAPSVRDVLPGLIAPSALSMSASAVQPWLDTPAEPIDQHLRENLQYPQTVTGAGQGWNGPYLSKVVGSDPWGRRYMVNTVFSRLGGRSSTNRNCCAVFVISAGPDGEIQTPFEQPISRASVLGDDIAVRIQ